MTTNATRHRFAALLLLSASLALTACSGSTSGNAAPRFTAIPSQFLSGTSDLTLDLDTYVTDREGDTITLEVVSGGGSFSGTVYSHTFDTVGTYPVTVKATDALGKNHEATFSVVVQSADLAVVQVGDNLQLMDVETLKFLSVASATGFTETFKGTTAKGHLIYERIVGTGGDLYVYNPHTTETKVLGNTAENDERFGALTTDNRVVFTRGSAGQTGLFIWNAITDVTTTIVDEPGEHGRDPLVNTGDLVFFELTVLGQGDIYQFDPSSNESVAVSVAVTDENLLAVLPDGGIVFNRVGPGGERDLHYFRVGFGVVEIGGDLGATIAAQTKTYVGKTSDSKVVFEVNGATDVDLYIWNPANGQSRDVAMTASTDDKLAGITALNEIVVNVVTSSSNGDLSIYDYATDTLTAISTDLDNDVFKGTMSNGDVVFLREDATGDQLHLYDTSVGSTSAIAAASGDDFAFDKILTNDNVVYRRTTAPTEMFLFSSGSSSSVLTGTVAFGGEAAGGDFVIAVDVGGQDDLTLYDDSASTTVSISTHPGNESFGFGLSDGRILFMRVETGETNLDLHLWTPTPTVTRLTTTTEDHDVLSLVKADDT